MKEKQGPLALTKPMRARACVSSSLAFFSMGQSPHASQVEANRYADPLMPSRRRTRAYIAYDVCVSFSCISTPLISCWAKRTLGRIALKGAQRPHGPLEHESLHCTILRLYDCAILFDFNIFQLPQVIELSASPVQRRVNRLPTPPPIAEGLERSSTTLLGSKTNLTLLKEHGFRIGSKTKLDANAGT